MRTVYLVSCVTKKNKHPSMAKDLYLSPWFKKARDFVEATGMPWYILSARYGLVDPNAAVAPYEQTLNKMSIDARRTWADGVLMQLTSILAQDDVVVMLAGARYREFLVPRLSNLVADVSAPMARMAIGKQMAWLGTQRATAE